MKKAKMNHPIQVSLIIFECYFKFKKLVFKTTPTFIQFLENSNSIQKAAQNFKINV